jgi:hypothetical protein
LYAREWRFHRDERIWVTRTPHYRPVEQVSKRVLVRLLTPPVCRQTYRSCSQHCSNAANTMCSTRPPGRKCRRRWRSSMPSSRIGHRCLDTKAQFESCNHYVLSIRCKRTHT